MTEELNFQAFFNARVREKGYTLERLSRVSGIAQKHLENLSAGNLAGLPPLPYLHGYLTRLGKILEFDAETWWERLKLDQEGITRSGAHDALPKNRYARAPIKGGWVLGALIAILLLALFVVRFPLIFGEPILMVTFPPQSPLTVTINEFIVAGTLTNGSSLSVNRNPVAINADGSWETTVLLSQGLNTIEIRAQKFLGRETTLVKQIIYEPKFTPTPELSEPGTLPEGDGAPPPPLFE